MDTTVILLFFLVSAAWFVLGWNYGASAAEKHFDEVAKIREAAKNKEWGKALIVNGRRIRVTKRNAINTID